MRRGILLLLLGFITLFSQASEEVKTKTIKGLIVSGEKPLFDVSVILDGTKFFAITDKKGKFEIEIPKYLWDEEIFIIFKCKGYEDNLVQFMAKKHFKKKLKVNMEDKFKNWEENYINPDEAIMEYNTIIQSKDVSKEETDK